MFRSRNPLHRLGEARAVDLALAGLFFALGMLAATIIFLVWG